MSSADSSKSIIARLPKYCAIFIGLGASIVYSILETIAISNSTSSTSAIAFLFLPIGAIFILVLFAFFGFCLGVVVQGVLDRYYRYRLRFFCAILIILATTFYVMPFMTELYSTYTKVNKISFMNAQELDQVYVNLPVDSSFGYDIYVLAAIAQNPNTSSELLDKIAHLSHPRLNDRLGSIIDLTKENRKGYATIRLVAMNQNTSLKTLEYMTDLNNYYLLGDIAMNPKLPVEYLHKLFIKAQNNKEGYLIEWGLAYNPSTPPDILRELSKKIKYGTGFDVINSALTNNPSTPDDVKEKLFKSK